MEFIKSVFSSLTAGFSVSLSLFFFTLLFAIPLGLIICFGSMSKIKVIRYVIRTFVWVIRGTPLMLQLIIVFYGPGLMANWAQNVSDPNFFTNWIATWKVMDRMVAAILAFSINYACYFSEIYRGGIESISKGQYEAGQVLGMTKVQVFFRIVLMQVVKRIVPPMSNEIITLVKDTSLARIISVYELIWAGQAFIKSSGVLWPLFATGAYYLVFCGILTVLLGKLEKKLDYYKV